MIQVAALNQDDLTHGERLLLRALRLHGMAASCTGLDAQLEHACGPAGPGACRALKLFVDELRRSAGRCIGLRLPAEPKVSADEVRLLNVFAAAQHDRYDVIDHELGHMTREAPSGWLGAAACMVGEAFDLGGLLLRPQTGPDTGCPMGAAPLASPQA